MVFHLCRKEAGMTLRELGDAAGGLDYAAVGMAVRRLKRRLTEEANLVDVEKRIIEMLKV